MVPVNVSCTRTEFQIKISREALPQLDRENIYLGNPSCSAQLTETSYKILARFVNCGTAGQVYKTNIRHACSDSWDTTFKTPLLPHTFLSDSLKFRSNLVADVSKYPIYLVSA